MTNILTIGLISEGSTDERFLPNIIKRTFEELAFERGKGEIEVYDPEVIKKEGKTFSEQVLKASIKYSWLNVLCIHTDADDQSE